MKSLNLGHKVNPLVIDRRILEAIVVRCGKFVKTIDFYSLDFHRCAIFIAVNQCPNIQSIICNKVSVKGLKRLTKHCKNIAELSIEEFELADELDQVLGDLFENNKKLQCLDILGYEGSGDCLSKLPFEEIISIKISSLRQWEPMEQNIINVIEKSKNLSTFKYETSNVNVFAALASHCRNLTEVDLKLGDDSDIDDMDSRLSQIFANNIKLKSIKLRDFHSITGECLISLEKNVIEEIELSQAENVHRDFLIKSLPNFTNLHILHLYFVGRIGFVDTAESISLCSKLETLVIIDKGVDKKLNLFASSKNIESLALPLSGEPKIVESFLEYMSCNLLELKHLYLKGSPSNLTNLSFNFNCNLLKLEVLNISYQRNITASGLGNLPNLRELYCEECENLEDDNLISLLKCARNLKFLDIRDCKKITNRIILTAIEETRKRTNNVVLEIQIGGTNIRTAEIKEKSPFLHLM